MDLRMSAKTNDRYREALGKFLQPSEVPRLLPKRALFAAFWVKYALKEHQIQKIHSRTIFSVIKNEWRVLWPPRLLWEIDMVLGMSTKANMISGNLTKNFLACFKAQPLIHSHPLFVVFSLKLSIKPQKWPQACVCVNKKWMGGRSTFSFALGDSYGPKDVCEIKWWV